MAAGVASSPAMAASVVAVVSAVAVVTAAVGAAVMAASARLSPPSSSNVANGPNAPRPRKQAAIGMADGAVVAANARQAVAGADAGRHRP